MSGAAVDWNIIVLALIVIALVMILRGARYSKLVPVVGIESARHIYRSALAARRAMEMSGLSGGYRWDLLDDLMYAIAGFVVDSRLRERAFEAYKTSHGARKAHRPVGSAVTALFVAVDEAVAALERSKFMAGAGQGRADSRQVGGSVMLVIMSREKLRSASVRGRAALEAARRTTVEGA